MMSAGKLDTRCSFQKEVKVSDGGGGQEITWPEQFSCWGALVLPSLRSQQEAIAAGAVQSTTKGTLTVRSDSGTTALITAGWRVVAKGRTWNIREVAPQMDDMIRMQIESGVPT